MTSTLGMTGIVFGLVEAGTTAGAAPLTVASLAVGLALLGLFVHNESRVEEPILPLRLLRQPPARAANVARGLLYAGMYGMFFFLSPVLPGRAGILAASGWRRVPAHAGLGLPVVPADGRVLVRRLPQKIVMMIGRHAGDTSACCSRPGSSRRPRTARSSSPWC